MSRRRSLPPCLKHRYGTEELAQAALDNIRSVADKTPFRREERFYECPDCRGFHLTSQQVMGAFS